MSRSAQSTLFGGLQPVHQFTSWDRPEISSLGLAWCETCCCRPAEPFTRLRVQPAAEREFRYTLHRACSEWEQWLKMELIHTTSMHYSHTTGCVCVCMCVWGWDSFFFLSYFLCPLMLFLPFIPQKVISDLPWRLFLVINAYVSIYTVRIDNQA